MSANTQTVMRGLVLSQLCLLAAICGAETEETIGESAGSTYDSPVMRKRYYLLPNYLMRLGPDYHKKSEFLADDSPLLSPHSPSIVKETEVPKELVPFGREGDSQMSEVQEESSQLSDRPSPQINAEDGSAVEARGKFPAPGQQQPQSASSITRPCYFSPVQCLLNIPEERINHFVHLIMPVASAGQVPRSIQHIRQQPIDSMITSSSPRPLVEGANRRRSLENKDSQATAEKARTPMSRFFLQRQNAATGNAAGRGDWQSVGWLLKARQPQPLTRRPSTTLGGVYPIVQNDAANSRRWRLSL